MLDQKLAEAMQRILAKTETRFPLTQVREELIRFGMGTRCGKSVFFSAKDKEEMKNWLKAKGFSLDQCVQPGMRRSDRLALTPHEKAGHEPIKQHRISIKALAGQPVLIGEHRLQLLPESHLDINWTTITDQIGHRCILVVENYENFNYLHETSFDLPEAFRSPLVIYRGDPHESRMDHVQQFLMQANRPVLAFMDADPAGIAIAIRFPHLVGMVIPPIDRLQAQLNHPQKARKDLFLQQYPVYGAILDHLPMNHPCAQLWKLISRSAAGVVQEHWVRETVSLAPLDL